MSKFKSWMLKYPQVLNDGRTGIYSCFLIYDDKERIWKPFSLVRYTVTDKPKSNETSN